ncbi:MAG: hypothetical protein AAF603_07905 [Pseudomonadota bacterium]
MMAATHSIKIFGERNTSTNALKQLVEKNADVVVRPSTAEAVSPFVKWQIRLINRLPHSLKWKEAALDRAFSKTSPSFAWKHAATSFSSVEDFKDVPVIFMTRHPASWLKALLRRPYNALSPIERPLDKFVTAPWQTLKRDRLEGRLLTPAVLYNEKIASYLSFAKQLEAAGYAYRFIRFEDFCVDQRTVFEEIRPLLKDAVDQPNIIRSSTKDASKDWRYYQDYYGQQKWVKDIPEAAKPIIAKVIDWDQLSPFEYSPI